MCSLQLRQSAGDSRACISLINFAESILNRSPYQRRRSSKFSINFVLFILFVSTFDICKYIQSVSREKDVFEINITPLIFSAEFIYYHEMIRYYMPFCVRFGFRFRSFLIRQHVAEQNGLDFPRWPLSLFPRSPGFAKLRQDQAVPSSLSFLLFEKM